MEKNRYVYLISGNILSKGNRYFVSLIYHNPQTNTLFAINFEKKYVISPFRIRSTGI